MELSSLAINGFNGLQNMELMGTIRGEPVMVLINSGASQNFISRTFVDKLQAPLEPTLHFGGTYWMDTKLYQMGCEKK